MVRINRLAYISILVMLGLAACSAPSDNGSASKAVQQGQKVTSDVPALEPDQAAVIGITEKIRLALKPCDEGFLGYRAKPSKEAAEAAAQKCLDASGTLSSISVSDAQNALSTPETEVIQVAAKECMISAGARYSWLNGVAEPSAKISDGEENSLLHNGSCIVKLTDAAAVARISAEDPRLKTPMAMMAADQKKQGYLRK